MRLPAFHPHQFLASHCGPLGVDVRKKSHNLVFNRIKCEPTLYSLFTLKYVVNLSEMRLPVNLVVIFKTIDISSLAYN